MLKRKLSFFLLADCFLPFCICELIQTSFLQVGTDRLPSIIYRLGLCIRETPVESIRGRGSTGWDRLAGHLPDGLLCPRWREVDCLFKVKDKTHYFGPYSLCGLRGLGTGVD